MDHARDPADLTGLEVSAIALNRTVDALTAEELAEPSLLPGWTRAHVVAHVALNGEAMARVVDGVARGETPAMYESDEGRNADIDELARADPAELRDRLLAATTSFSDEVANVDNDRWGGAFSRTPGAAPWPAATLVATRRRELEIHHADLGTSYTHREWPADFVVELLDVVTVDHGGAGPFQLRASDLGHDWSVGGAGGPMIVGLGADLGWWLTGRSVGDGLACDGALPRLGPWQRARSTDVP
jgi:maleylpyruvate isomerase